MRIIEESSPADMSPCTGCADAAEPVTSVSRRTALSGGLLSTIAAVLGAPLLTACTPHTPKSAATPALPVGHWMLRIRAADFPSLATQGGIARVDDRSDKPVAVVRTATGYAAFSLRCPHAGGTLDPVDDGFLCPNHGAKFSADGTWSGGHAAKNLKVLDTMYEETSGVLTIVG